ncbi:MAG: ArsA family ATPase [Actinomycetota bacterium]|nr:ArsA family ATPase [Actinomycetota bacterium]
MSGLLDKRLIFVTGKGGVGKSTVAIALGMLGARSGLRTIVVELAAQDRIRGALGGGRAVPVERPGPLERPVPLVEHELAPGLFTISIDPQHAMDEYLRVKVGQVGHVLGSSKLFQAFAMATPGMRELLTVGKVWELAQLQRRTRGAAPYDLVVVDSPASGHGLGILRTPRTFAEIARVGPIAHQGEAIATTIADPTFTAVVVVASPEEMAVTETLLLRDALAGDGLALHEVIVNAVYPARFESGEVPQLRQAAEDAASPLARAAIRAALSQRDRADNQRRQLSRLADGLGERLVELPFMFADHLGQSELERLADVLAAGLARTNGKARKRRAPAPCAAEELA